jgi:hypothetical protein
MHKQKDKPMQMMMMMMMIVISLNSYLLTYRLNSPETNCSVRRSKKKETTEHSQTKYKTVIKIIIQSNSILKMRANSTAQGTVRKRARVKKRNKESTKQGNL